MQAVGLALPELHHLGVQDVATPTGRSTEVYCSLIPSHPKLSCSRLQDAADEGFLEKEIYNSTGRALFSFLDVHQAQVSLTSILV